MPRKPAPATSRRKRVAGAETAPARPRIHEYVPVRQRGVVTIPAEIRERLRLDDPGAQLEFIETDDGRIEVRGALPHDADQSWFWTERWQRMEREADEDFAAGRHTVTADVDAFLAELDE